MIVLLGLGIIALLIGMFVGAVCQQAFSQSPPHPLASVHRIQISVLGGDPAMTKEVDEQIRRFVDELAIQVYEGVKRFVDAYKICPTCQKTFLATRSDQKNCSVECAAPSRRAAKRRWWNANRGKGAGLLGEQQ